MATKPNRVESLLDPYVIRELAASTAGFDRGELLSSLIDQMGGVAMLAKTINLEFAHAPRGSMVRQRILDMVCRLISQHSATETARAVEDMDDGELRHAILSLVPQVVKVGAVVAHVPGEPADGEA